MSRRKRKKKGISLTGLTVLLVLCVIMILIDLYLVMSTSLSSRSSVSDAQSQTEEDTAPAVSSLPQIIQVEQPDVQLSDESDDQTETAAEETGETASSAALDGSWQNSTLIFTYDTASMWVSESGGVISVTGLAGDTLPRMDLQVLDNAEDLTQEEFASLADAAIRAYFSFEPAADATVQVSLTGSDGNYEAELTVAETAASPALRAWVSLQDGILTTMLLEADADTQTVELWLTALRSVGPL